MQSNWRVGAKRLPDCLPESFAESFAKPLAEFSMEPKRLHVAIIMDGNGRWAERRGLPRTAGHYAGVAAMRDVTKAASERADIATLTVFGLSSDNLRRPPEEVSGLLEIIASYLENETAALVRAGVRFTAIGRRDRLPERIVTLIRHAEAVTGCGPRLHLRVALDYSARDSILAAARACAPDAFTRKDMSAKLGGAGDVDILIRTSGEQRLSDFLLWEAAYAELYFTKTLWPDFDAEGLAQALTAFNGRNRRFGGVPDVRSTGPALLEAV